MILRILTSMILASLLVKAQTAWSDEMDGTDCLLSDERTQTEDLKDRALTQEEPFRQSYDTAECLRRVAAAKGAEWLETESLLIRSLEEAKGGRWDSALALAEKARFQSEQALRQAEHEKESWKQRVVN